MSSRILQFTFALLAVATTGAAADQACPNVLFLAIDDLRSDVGVLSVAHAKTPQLDAFARTARVFSRHYVHVPTCGASRCALLRGCYPTVPAHVTNNAIRSTQADWASRSMPAFFHQHGYLTAVGCSAARQLPEDASLVLRGRLSDASPVVRIEAAAALAHQVETEEALPVLAAALAGGQSEVALDAARAIELLGSPAQPLLATMQQVLEHARKAEQGNDII